MRCELRYAKNKIHDIQMDSIEAMSNATRTSDDRLQRRLDAAHRELNVKDKAINEK